MVDQGCLIPSNLDTVRLGLEWLLDRPLSKEELRQICRHPDELEPLLDTALRKKRLVLSNGAVCRILSPDLVELAKGATVFHCLAELARKPLRR